MTNQNAPNKGRKFAVVILVSLLMGIGMAAGLIAALSGASAPWLAATLPILASTYPAYMGANAVQKHAQAKTKDNQNNMKRGALWKLGGFM